MHKAHMSWLDTVFTPGCLHFLNLTITMRLNPNLNLFSWTV